MQREDGAGEQEGKATLEHDGRRVYERGRDFQVNGQ